MPETVGHPPVTVTPTVTGGPLLLIGDTDLSDAVVDHLERWNVPVSRLDGPDDDVLLKTLAEGADAVAVVCRDDIHALRYALLAEHILPGVPLLVTLFDKTVAEEVVRSVPNCTVVSMTDALVPAILGPCVGAELLSLFRADGGYVGVRREGSDAIVEALPHERRTLRNRLRDVLRGQFRALEGTTRALLVGLGGLLGVFVIDIALAMAVLHEPVPTAMWNAARTLTTVGSGEAAFHGPPWYHVATTVTLLAALGFTALFTAGLVDRVTSHRFTGIVGARAVPRRDHVIVVGLGQVGLRLCRELQLLGVRVVAVERDEQAPCLPLARSLGIPVILGRGGDRFLLHKLALPKARALAAVSSQPLENIAVAVAARSIAPDQRIVLRSGGEEDVTAESQSLFRIATVCDLNTIAGSFIAATAAGLSPRTTFTMGGRVHAVLGEGLVAL